MRIGIDLGGTKIEVIALSNEGKELFRKRVPTPRGSYEATLAAIKGLVDDAEQATGQTGTVGIGIPGTISPFSHKVKNANSVWLNGQPLDKDLCRLLGREVRIANDANCMTVSEATDGAGAGSAVVLALILGTGCGSGIVIHGKPHHGGNGIGGEWGHNPLPWMDDEEKAVAQQTPCYCGKHGCIEQFVSGTGLCDDYERRLAKALSSYVNMLDPDVIVFAGGVCNVDRLYTNVPKLMPQYIFGHEFHTPIRKALHGDSSGVRGAAWLWPLEK
ncbi:ROK family protein [Pasteurella multocida]|uniref:ROK family protein n=1 Tax=Pasteurella multocida TaxID=747 RepID=UPI0029A4C292|nr:ROK family protein [Pasteurella multocida]MDX3957265.1 ROK family protein [Pasteurella multocida]